METPAEVTKSTTTTESSQEVKTEQIANGSVETSISSEKTTSVTVSGDQEKT